MFIFIRRLYSTQKYKINENNLRMGHTQHIYIYISRVESYWISKSWTFEDLHLQTPYWGEYAIF